MGVRGSGGWGVEVVVHRFPTKSLNSGSRTAGATESLHGFAIVIEYICGGADRCHHDLNDWAAIQLLATAPADYGRAGPAAVPDGSACGARSD